MKKTMLIVVITLLVIATPSFAGVHVVPRKTINVRQGDDLAVIVANAPSGSTIRIHNGVYFGPININQKDLSIIVPKGQTATLLVQSGQVKGFDIYESNISIVGLTFALENPLDTLYYFVDVFCRNNYNIDAYVITLDECTFQSDPNIYGIAVAAQGNCDIYTNRCIFDVSIPFNTTCLGLDVSHNTILCGTMSYINLTLAKYYDANVVFSNNLFATGDINDIWIFGYGISSANDLTEFVTMDKNVFDGHEKLNTRHYPLKVGATFPIFYTVEEVNLIFQAENREGDVISAFVDPGIDFRVYQNSIAVFDDSVAGAAGLYRGKR